MSTTTTIKSETRFLGLPKNKTGLFAADTIHEVKPTRNHLITVPALSPQFRQTNTTNLLLASAEQNHHQLQQYRLSKNEIQQYYPLDKTHGSVIDSSNDSRLTTNGIRNGFRPSTVRHQRGRITTAMTQRSNPSYETQDVPPRINLIQSHASAKLRSEINHINEKLNRNKDSSKSLRLQNNREFNDTPRSTLSYATSCHDSSTSTILTADRIHQRFTSAITNHTANTRTTIQETNDTMNGPPQILSGIASPLPPLENNEKNEHPPDAIDFQPTHAYQIPQQSNVGSESIFLIDPPPLSSIKTRSAKHERYSKDSKSVFCPFYVMYLTNLAMHQRQDKDEKVNDKENDRTALASSSAMRKVPVNSRTSTANPKRLSTRKQVNSPVSLNTFSTVEDDDRTTNSSSIPHNKRLSSKFSLGENENSHPLRDILRTSSWNHVQV